MHRLWKSFVFSLLILLVAASVVYASEMDTVTLKLDSEKALVNNAAYKLQVAPRAIKGTTVVPLRFLVEALGARASWESETKGITVQDGDNVVQLHIGEEQTLINGVKQSVAAPPLIEEGTTLVPLRFLAENFNYNVKFLSKDKEIHIKQLPPPPPPNGKPVAEFEVEKDTVAQGETVVYEDVSHDPDGDKVVEAAWTGRERAFFTPGEHKVTLKVKDSNGAWSEQYIKVIMVTEEVKMNEFDYNLHYPIPGETLDISGIPVLDLKEIDPAVSMNREKVMISNSPEVITENGILYSSVLEGEHRLYYHHLNDAGQTKRVYLLAINQGADPVRLTVKSSGIAGPASPMAVGRAAAYRYLEYVPGESKFLDLQPGEKVILNKGGNSIVPPNKAVHGIFDINAHDELFFAVVAVDNEDTLANLDELSELAPDNHIRGTFSRSNRFLFVNLRDKEPVRLVVADGDDDSFQYGNDEGLVRKNKGNYGLTYRIKIHSQNRVAVLFSPRGGVFAGASEWEREAFYLPNKGILKPKQGAMIGVVEAGEEDVLEFIPPAGSYLPVNLLFIPF